MKEDAGMSKEEGMGWLKEDDGVSKKGMGCVRKGLGWSKKEGIWERCGE